MAASDEVALDDRQVAVRLAARDARETHDAVARPDAWPCSPDEYEPGSREDGALLVCENCGAIVWRRDGEVVPAIRQYPRRSTRNEGVGS